MSVVVGSHAYARRIWKWFGVRIAMLGWEFPPFVSGGLGVHCYELTRALASRGVEIDFFMPKTSTPVYAPWMNVIQVSYAAIGQGVKAGPYGAARFVSKNPGNELPLDFFAAVEEYNFLAAQVLADRHREKKYDVVHGHDWITMRAGVEAKKRTGLPLVFFVHSTEYDRTANLSPYQWIVGIEKHGMTSADLVMTNSRMMARRLEQFYGISREKLRIVYNAVDATKFRRRSEAKKELGLDGKIVLFHGRLSIQKGPEFFLMAAKKVLEKEPGARFIMSGKGDFLPRLVELAIDLGIEDKVVFAGYVPDEKLPLLYAASDAYVLPSVSEPFGITVLEAMAAGVPVIVSKTTGAGEVVNYCLRVDFWDVDEMANKIIAVLKYSELKDVLSEGAAGEVKRFSWDRAAEETINVYNELIGMRS